jgi:N-acyl-D-aspartate/D-glutamate deacylase
MTMAHRDLLIRGGTVVDGSGVDPFVADVLIEDRVISAVRAGLAGHGCQEIDAEGLMVTPGFVDVHTHYDGQVTWENTLGPSSNHGVTTVVMGNCGVGFAPCRPESREDLVRLMEGIEDIPEVVMTTGVPWEWETFPDYLDFLECRSYDMDIATQLPHAALRLFVMGERGMAREVATHDDMQRMRDLAQEAIEAGALGFSTSRSINHKTVDGDPIPSFQAAERELHAIASGLTAAGMGVLQVITDFPTVADVPERARLLIELSRRSGRPLSFTLAQFHSAPRSWVEVLAKLEEAHAAGVLIRGQVLPRPMGMLMSLETTRNPFSDSETYVGMAGDPVERRVAAMRTPEVRQRIISEARASDCGASHRRFDKIFRLRDTSDYEPPQEESMSALATFRGVEPDVLAYDFLLEHDGRGLLWLPFANYSDGDLTACLTMMRSEATIIGLGDGGAHYGLLCDSSYPTFMLTYWGRDRVKGDRLSLPAIVRSLAHDTAMSVGLNDRGLVRPGYKADLNLIDFDALQLGMPIVSYDLPSGAKRLSQAAAGYHATIVSGQVTYRDGRPTGALPGRLVRGPQMAHARADTVDQAC